MKKENKNAVEENKNAVKESYGIITMGNGAELIAKRNGYNIADVEESEKGNLLVTIHSEDGEQVLAEVVTSDDAKSAYKALNALNNYEKLAGIYKAWNIARVAELAEDAGFKSVGAFLNMQFPNLAVNTCNQLKAVADAFIITDTDDNGNEYPVWLFDWLHNVNISNVQLIMGLYNKFDESCTDTDDNYIIGERFYDEFIASGKIHLLKPQAKLKEELRALSGKTDKAGKAGKTGKASKAGKADNDGSVSNPISDGVEEADEVTIAKAVSILEKYNLHDLAKMLVSEYEKALEESKEE